MLFWTALFMLSIALQYAAAAAPKTALATGQECESYAIFTSDPTGEENNQNLYDSKLDVYLNGGPATAGGNLTAGSVFYYQVQEPDGTPLMEIRSVTVLGSGPHAGRFFVGLAPFDDTTNPGGEYKVVVSTESDLAPGGCTKSDNFKVVGDGALRITKTIEGGPDGFDATFTFSVDCAGAAPIDDVAITTSGGTGSTTISDIVAGNICTVGEGALPQPPTDYEWDEPTITGSPATIVDDRTATVAVVNHLDFIERPSLNVVKTVSTSAAGPWPGSHDLAVQVGTTVYFRITISNTGNVPLTGVTLSDNTYNLVAKGCVIPTTLAVSGSYDCNYSVVAGLGSVTNIATGDSTETPSDNDTATITGTPAPPAPSLTIVKTNNAPLDELELPTAAEGGTVTFTLAYTFSGTPVSGATIKDVLPAGLTYVTGSATGSDQMAFVGYDAATRTLSWAAGGDVTKSGQVTYQATVDAGAAALVQPLKNVATIDSNGTEPDSDDSVVYVAALPQAETSVPTPPQTDAIGSTSSAPAGSLLLVLLALAGIVLAVVFVAPTPASLRKRMDR